MIPGCFTPSDINIAYQNGLTLVKIFPADALGKNYIKSVQPVFPGMNFMPTGGIHAETEDISEWLNGGAIAAGLGSSLIGKDNNEEELTLKTKNYYNNLINNSMQAPQNLNIRWWMLSLVFLATTINYLDRQVMGFAETCAGKRIQLG